ncbi:MAG: hypothetical protein V4481_05220 [Patescibacteria group bacterium]
MVYPDHHPKAEAIREKRKQIDELYAKLKSHEDKSREYYKMSMDNLKAMGKELEEVHGTLHLLAEEIKSLKGIVDSPLI